MQSAPFKIIWAGFQSDTLTLQNSGWSLAIEDDYSYVLGAHRVRFILRHEYLDLHCFTDIHEIQFPHIQDVRQITEMVRFSIQVLGKNIYYRSVPEFNIASIYEVDARPQMMVMEEKSIKDLSIFRTLVKPDSALIVEPEKISELLQKIVEAQAPNQAEIRERMRKHEARDNLKQTLHAQILSVAA